MSRYDTMAPQMTTYRGKLTRCIPLRPNPARAFSFTFHQVDEAGERVDLIAAKYWGDARLWSEIADVNPEILYWGTLKPGTVIRVQYV
ncbi:MULTISPECIES: hypothetical protein [Streptosporangium]|uniref:LysM domain-containing protein n=1 Tax=Streptosporangium brasiliense TaxID=47480 RepID=A0ABT9RNN4_9ACTN|nr:hypothetical protein [Streptosporangium brasiliense]MDP9870319.1 hypothetical protein [Streptosporangium brasiliense]